jgi:uncharacterized membrane protein
VSASPSGSLAVGVTDAGAGDSGAPRIPADIYAVGPRFFATMGIAFLQGNDFRAGLKKLLLIVVGLGIALIGLLVWSGGLSWFGRLPGDIRIERETVHVYIPLVSMFLVSVVLSLIMYLINRLF